MKLRIDKKLTCLTGCLILAGCAPAVEPEAATDGSASAAQTSTADNTPSSFIENPEGRQALFGDLHVHTRYSFDAYIFSVRAGPDDAYRYAKGEAIKHAAGFDVKLSGPPLDFLAVTDHAEYLGTVQYLEDPESPLSKLEYAKDLAGTVAQIRKVFGLVEGSLSTGIPRPELQVPEYRKSTWQDIIAAADRHNQPGRFTALVGYEFTSAPGGFNLHRNVIFGPGSYPDMPYSAFDSQNPENLWSWMERQREKGSQVLAIPHNANASNGLMFETTDWSDAPIDFAYAQRRARNEPLMEITQVKGTSETHPMISPNDEWAGFEIMASDLSGRRPTTDFMGSYARGALANGLSIWQREGANPYQFGFIGSSDTHNAAGSYDESNFFSKAGVVDVLPAQRGSVPPEGKSWEDVTGEPGNVRRLWGASGLAGVWAEENTRSAIFAALKRRETFGTSGPRMRIRLFAADAPAASLSGAGAVRTAYQKGVPMGGTYDATAKGAPNFLIWAVADPQSAPFQRLQIVKGWLENGKQRETVVDVACANGAVPTGSPARCPDNGASVDISTCKRNGAGSGELRTVWRDRDYKPGKYAYYYARVLENPTCRWSTWDAVRTGRPRNPELPATLQERAWSSPIWIKPAL